MTNEKTKELEARIEKLEAKNKALRADIRSMEEDMINARLITRAIYELQEEVRKLGGDINCAIYAPNMVGGL